jgi:hypothetical protein
MDVLRCRSGIPAFALVLALGLACDKPAETSAPAGGGAGAGAGGAAAGPNAADGGPAGAGGAGAEGSQAGDAGAAAAPPCQAELDLQPTAFFGYRILMSLPKGVEMVEQNPFFARSATGTQVSSCGTTIPFGAIGYVRSTASLAAIRKHIMMLRGFEPEELSYSNETSQGDTTIATYDVSGDAGIRGLVFFKRDRGWYYWALYEASSEDFPNLEGVFRSSFASLLIRPVRDGS